MLAEETSNIPWVAVVVIIALLAVLLIVVLVSRVFFRGIQACSRVHLRAYRTSLKGRYASYLVLSKVQADRPGLNMTTGHLESHYLPAGACETWSSRSIAANRPLEHLA